ncbi:MAG: dTMP kinase [Thermoplasmata archaeon]|nr:dTMP kinase [Thermoplasmata archaeon]
MREPKRRGRLLALEGIDGAGKSTLQRKLLRRLRRRGLKVGAWREPVDPAMGRVAQSLGPTDPLGAAIEFTVDRWVARPRLEALLRRCDLVISDRSFYSTLAYQGSALDPDTRKGVVRLQAAATVRPDRVLLLDLSPKDALERVGRRGAAPAPLERSRTLRRVAASYRGYARSKGWRSFDARRPSEETADLAERWIWGWLGGRRPVPGRGRG